MPTLYKANRDPIEVSPEALSEAISKGWSPFPLTPRYGYLGYNPDIPAEQRSQVRKDFGPLSGIGDAIAGMASAPSDIYHAFADKPSSASEEQLMPNRLRLAFRRMITDPMIDLYSKSKDPNIGPSETAAYRFLSGFPVVGPLAAHLGERAGTGDIGGAIAEGATYAIAPEATRRAGSLLKGTSTIANRAIGKGLGVEPRTLKLGEVDYPILKSELDPTAKHASWIDAARRRGYGRQQFIEFSNKQYQAAADVVHKFAEKSVSEALPLTLDAEMVLWKADFEEAMGRAATPEELAAARANATNRPYAPDYKRWRNENYTRHRSGLWEDRSGNLHTDEALHRLHDQVSSGLPKSSVPAESANWAADTLRLKAKPMYDAIDHIIADYPEQAQAWITFTNKVMTKFFKEAGLERVGDIQSGATGEIFEGMDELRRSITYLNEGDRFTAPADKVFQVYSAIDRAIMKNVGKGVEADSLVRQLKLAKWSITGGIEQALDSVDHARRATIFGPADNMTSAYIVEGSVKELWHKASKLWNRYGALRDLATALDEATQGTPIEAQTEILRAGGKPRPPELRGAKLTDKLNELAAPQGPPSKPQPSRLQQIFGSSPQGELQIRYLRQIGRLLDEMQRSREGTEYLHGGIVRIALRHLGGNRLAAAMTTLPGTTAVLDLLKARNTTMVDRAVQAIAAAAAANSSKPLSTLDYEAQHLQEIIAMAQSGKLKAASPLPAVPKPSAAIGGR